MNATVEDLRATIVPKSDQLNAEQLLSGPKDIIVAEVRIGGGEEQPVVVHYLGDEGRPYKPCKTMRKLLIFAWGVDGRAWAGKAARLYCDPAVKFGGEAVGGIRISHLSDIAGEIKVSLTSTRGKKAQYKVDPMPNYCAELAAAQDGERLKELFKGAYRSTKDAATRDAYKAAYEARLAEVAAS